jgi:pimeloyl-ACP methyl ester carboxylesterase
VDAVVLVHGLWMHGWVMKWMGMRLEDCGFNACYFSYPSMRGSLSQNASILADFAKNIAAPRIHFIGHSLGGLLILQMLHDFPQDRVGRIILAGSPYNGCRVATKLAGRSPGRYILGQSMLQWLGQTPLLSSPVYDIGVIAGCKGIGGGRLISRLASPNDGVVAVEETRIEFARDQIVLDVNHSGMLLSAELARQACAFLRYGYFLHNGPNRKPA